MEYTFTIVGQEPVKYRVTAPKIIILFWMDFMPTLKFYIQIKPENTTSIQLPMVSPDGAATILKCFHMMI